ncbi:uncharacterized protein LACBIDRAFT_335564 [Laccaria bicolor S238N-H82]|uniref:Predicted protein n=1 Tax=Laccaria bicolor (strain S238N-H82 / ATCC MYA-4686) TaxID=486041 RepID=B0E2N8_LACBS|nr:uncharacterized protein LACBIDRAFT_335564 [Laccaria bicolor S238N-H82]EDQ98900.1 predicted protein [Laccaria bicolor S238N-H82]|eukprot:XP_001890445.1 predicted protein [Laccaria bicolor S238N-H82]
MPKFGYVKLISTRYVVAHLQQEQIHEVVTRLAKGVSPGSRVFLAKYQQGLKEVMGGLTDAEKEEYKGLAEEWTNAVPPPDVQRKLNSKDGLGMMREMDKVKQYQLGVFSWSLYLNYIKEFQQGPSDSPAQHCYTRPRQKRKAPHFDLDGGLPVLPLAPEDRAESGNLLKSLIREFMTIHYRLASGKPSVVVSWFCLDEHRNTLWEKDKKLSPALYDLSQQGSTPVPSPRNIGSMAAVATAAPNGRVSSTTSSTMRPSSTRPGPTISTAVAALATAVPNGEDYTTDPTTEDETVKWCKGPQKTTRNLALEDAMARNSGEDVIDGSAPILAQKARPKPKRITKHQQGNIDGLEDAAHPNSRVAAPNLPHPKPKPITKQPHQDPASVEEQRNIEDALFIQKSTRPQQEKVREAPPAQLHLEKDALKQKGTKKAATDITNAASRN